MLWFSYLRCKGTTFISNNEIKRVKSYTGKIKRYDLTRKTKKYTCMLKKPLKCLAVCKKGSTFAPRLRENAFTTMLKRHCRWLKCGNSSVGRAQPCQGWGRGSESRFPLDKIVTKESIEGIFLRTNAQVAELVDAHVSGACVERRAGSSPVLGTLF